MRILFLWTGVTSYMADCWRELARHADVDLKVVIEWHRSGTEIDVAGVLYGFDVRVVNGGTDVEFGGWKPDVIFAVGWRSASVRRLVKDRRFRDVPKVCCFDMPWRWELRCIAARFVLRSFLRRYDAAFVPGERAERYARWLGFVRIFKGLFSLDTERFASGGTRDFMFIGRDAPEKRIDLLRSAYDLYRAKGGSWSLDIYGGGNFVQPSEVPNLYRAHACLVMASSFDPWPLVILEATGAGMMVIASDRCGNVDELGARKVRYGDVDAMADAMLEAERGEVHPAGRERALPYDCRPWADRVVCMCKKLMEGGTR